MRALVATLVALAVLLAAAVGGIGWYFAGVATEVDHSSEYPLTVLDTTPKTVTLPLDPTTRAAGTWALTWEGGRAVLGPVVSTTSGTVVRGIDRVLRGDLAKGEKVAVDSWIHDGDPKIAHGLEFQNVTYPSKLGPMPAWYVPGRSSTWVIGVHGRNSDRVETLRAIPAAHRLGLPVLSIAYRNDKGAPASPDGKNHLGDTEWNDVAAAIAYARSRGATGVVLHGWSMGGAMAMTALRRAADPAFVRGVVLDSPVMDWGATLDKQGDERGLPRFVTGVAKQVLRLRIGIDLAAFDQRRFAPDLRTPVLMYTTAHDATVDNRASLAFAAKAPPGLVTHVPTDGGHTDSWNVDPAAYERALTTFLARTALR